MTDRIRSGGQVAWALTGLTVVLVILGYIAWYMRVIWPPLLLAGIIVFVLNPIVTLLARHHVPRLAGTAVAYLLLLGIVVASGFLIAPQAQKQWDGLAEAWEEDLRPEVEAWLDDRAEQSEDQGWPVQIPTFAELEDAVFGNDEPEDEEEGDTAGEFLAQIDTARDVGMRMLNVGLIIVMSPVMAFYMLVDLPNIRRRIEGLIPEQRRQEVLLVGQRLNLAIGGYFRGQLLISTIVGFLSGLGMWVIDLPFAVAVGVIAGVTNMIPMIGPWVGGVPAVIIALTMEDFGTAIWAVIILASIQQLESVWISPVIMRRAVKLHPAVVMLALFAAGNLLGFIGLLLAVPITASLKVLIGHVWRTYVLEQPLDEKVKAFEAMDSQQGGTVGTDVGDDQAHGTNEAAHPLEPDGVERRTEGDFDPDPDPGDER